MNLAEVTAPALIAAVRRVIAKRGPEYVYPAINCTYGGADEGLYSERCIFGEALIGELGVPYDWKWEGKSIDDILVAAGYDDVAYYSAANDVQEAQDSGCAYGEIEGLVPSFFAYGAEVVG